MEEFEEGKSSLFKVLADESDSENFDKNLDERLTRLAKAKSKQVSILDYLKSSSNDTPVIKKLIADLSECGSYLVFRNYYQKETIRLLRANFCKRHLICPLCAIRRGAKLLFSLLQKHELIIKENPDFEPHMLTFTIKNGFELDERFYHLVNSVTKLINRRRNQLTRAKIVSEFAKLQGGCGSYEITYSETTGWHPHVHMVVYLKKSDRISVPKLIEEWKSITKDSFILDFRKMDSSVKSFLEVVKYALKFSSLPYPKLLDAFGILKGRNLYRSFGCLYGLTLPDELEDDISDIDELDPYIDMIYRYIQSGGYQLAEIRAQDPKVE